MHLQWEYKFTCSMKNNLEKPIKYKNVHPAIPPFGIYPIGILALKKNDMCILHNYL